MNKTFSSRLVLALVLFPVMSGLGVLSCTSEPQGKVPQQTVQPQPARPQPAVKPSLPEPSGTAALLRRISELLERNEYAAAIDLFDRIDPVDAETTNIRLLKASVYLSAGSINETRSIANTVLAKYPGHTGALLVLAGAEEAAGRPREQRLLLEKILKIDAAHVPALVSMGNLLVRSNTTLQAGSYYDRALAAEPDNGEALLGRAWVYRNARNPKRAEALLNRAVETYPRWARAFQERGRLYKARGFPREALADLDRARDLEPGNYFIACDRGDALKDLSRKTEALAEYERAITINPNHFMAYVYSAGIKDELGQYDSAEEDYKTLTRLNPDYYFAFEGLGIHLMRRGDWLAARDAFMEAYKRSNGSSYGLLAALNWIKGGTPHESKAFLAELLRKVQRDSPEYGMLRLYHDMSGDAGMANRIDGEKNLAKKSRMLYYLANYYDIRGNKNLADRLFLQVRDLNIQSIPEWRLNEWALESRGLAFH